MNRLRRAPAASARLFALALASPALLAGCGGDRSYHDQRFVFGTLVEIQTYGADPALARRAVGAVYADYQRLNEALHPWRPGALSRINTLLASGEWATAGPSNLRLIEQSIRLSRLSDGLFNPAIGRLVGLWGFHSDTLPETPPPQARIDALVAARPAMTDIELRGIRIRSRNPVVQLDFGAIAKGYAVDLGIARLRAAGIENAIINTGGDLRVIGRRGDRPWTIGIRHPRRAGLLASVRMGEDESIFTSGDYERFFVYRDKRYHHIFDPRTGRPVRGTVSATVIHDNGLEADAAVTALFVAGPRDWHRIARRMGIRYAMLVDDEGTVHMNPAMAARVRFEVDPPPPVILSPTLP